MRATATLSAILAASAFTQAASLTSESQLATSSDSTSPQGTGATMTVPGSTIPHPILSTASGSPCASANSSGILPTGTGSTGLPPVPTTSSPPGPTSGAALTTTQKSCLAMGIAVAMASLML